MSDTTGWYFRPFEHDTRDGHLPYRFVMPHIAISGENDVTVDYDRERGQWHVVQETDGLRWEAWGDSQPEAVLALIALRATGKVAYFATPPEETPTC